jgi:hypothetical protein
VKGRINVTLMLMNADVSTFVASKNSYVKKIKLHGLFVIADDRAGIILIFTQLHYKKATEHDITKFTRKFLLSVHPTHACFAVGLRLPYRPIYYILIAINKCTDERTVSRQ